MLAKASTARESRVQARVIDAATAARESNKKTCIHVFASERSIGGGYKYGAIGQEEDLLREFPFYDTLLSDDAKPFYEAGARADENGTGNILLVTVPKYDLGFALCAAPKSWMPSYEDYLAGLFGVVAAQGFEHLVTGAWGCGNFGVRYDEAGEAFRRALAHRCGPPHITVVIPKQNQMKIFAKGARLDYTVRP